MTDQPIDGIELGRILQGLDHAPLVYFLRVGDRVKIGTTTDIVRRVAELSFSMSDVVKVVPGGRDVERALHERWAVYRVDGNREWFFVRGSLTTFLRTSAARRRGHGRHSRRHRAAPLAVVPTERPSADEGGDLVTLREAADLVGTTHHVLRRARHIDPEFPRPATDATPGAAFWYRPDDIARWFRSRPGMRTAS